MCEKIQYKSMLEANRQLLYIWKRKPYRTERKSYLCPKCNFWHLTSKE